MAHNMKLATRTMILISMASLMTACAAERDAKPTKMRPELRRKLGNGDQQRRGTIDDVGGARGRGQGQSAETGGASDDTTVFHNRTCSLIADENKPCDAIAVKVNQSGKIVNLIESNIENVEHGLKVADDQIQRTDHDAQGNGGKFTAKIESTKGRHQLDGRDVLYLSYILPFKEADLKDAKSTVQVFLNDAKLERNTQFEILISSREESKDLVIVRITDRSILENINFNLEIQGEIAAGETTSDGAAETAASGDASATDTSVNVTVTPSN